MFESPEGLIDTWLACINGRRLEDLLACYDDTAILIPTFSNRLLDRPEKIRRYFEVLAGREELSIALHANTLVIQPLEGRLHAICGIYCWRFAVEGELLSFEARFSLLADLGRPAPILHHHSSQIPRTL